VGGQQQEQQAPQQQPLPQEEGRSAKAKKGKKRKNVDSLSLVLSKPKKRKLRTTSEYIYETLFKDGRENDLVVEALGFEWKLHKVDELGYETSKTFHS
jgi:hypothetical protein